MQTGWADWIALGMVKGVGSVVGRCLVETFGEPAAVFAAARGALEAAGARSDVARAILRFAGRAEAEEQASKLARSGGRLVTWRSDLYPQQLRQIHDPPLCLFVLGELTPSDDLSVAVVGSRAPSRYGRDMAGQLAEGLARCGLTVVSGLARGVDAMAHDGALRVGGRTIAVLGNGIDVIYPSEHHRLRMQIIKSGAVVSELPMGARPEPHNFPARNRIISGLTLGTVVVEATERSGSLITARCALEQNREVFAVPGPVGALSRGPHRLIREGAVLVESAEDVLREIAPPLLVGTRVSAAPVAVDESAARVLDCLAVEALHVDELIQRTGMSTPDMLRILLDLEIAGHVRQLPGKCFELYPAAPVAGPNRNV